MAGSYSSALRTWQDFRDGKEEHEVHGAGEHIARDEEIVNEVEADIEDCDRIHDAVWNFQADKAGDDQRAQDESASGEDHSGAVKRAGTRNREVSAGD